MIFAELFWWKNVVSMQLAELWCCMALDEAVRGLYCLGKLETYPVAYKQHNNLAAKTWELSSLLGGQSSSSWKRWRPDLDPGP